MKKFIIVLLASLLLFGCGRKPIPDFDSNFTIDTYQCDMSGYNGLQSVGHNFLGTTVSELEKTINEKGYGAFVLSRTGCDHCQIVMKYIDQAAMELNVNVYYIDGESDIYPIVGSDDYQLLDSILKPIEEEIDGEIALQTPHFFTVVNGEFVDSIVGTKTKNSDNLSDKDIEKIINRYKEALQIFVK